MATIDKYLKVRKGVDAPDVLTSSATIYDYLHTPVVYFDTASPALPAVGGLVWDDGEGTLSLGLKGGNLNLEIGQENIALCYNGTASAIAKGNVVYVSGAQGQRPSIDIATAATEQGSSKVFGIAAESIAPGAEGFVATFGVVPEINTQGFTEGAALWLSASPGKFTQTKPLSPNHLVFVGYCLKANASSGRIFVNPQNGYELEELHDVLITSASNNNIISYNAASGLWINKNLLNAIKEVDGAGSGIDADLLDGLDSTYFMPVSASSTFDEVTYTTDPPSSPNVGDIWVESDVDVSLQTYHAAYSASAPTEPIVGDLWVDSSQNIELTLTPSTASAIYLRQDTASAQYLTKTDASNTYFPISSSGSLLTETEASSIYAPLSSPNLTGVPLAPTAASGTNTTQIATTQFVRTEVANLVDSAPSTLDTLNELAAALGDDPNFATTITNSISTKLDAGTASALYLRKDTASGTYLPISATATFSSGGGYSKSFLLGGM